MTTKNALVTGASSGIGRALALSLAKQGYRVYAAARRADRLETLRQEHESIVPLTLDVAKADETEARVRALDAECEGGLDLVIANAGVGQPTDGANISFSVVKELIDVNVTGAVATLCGALPGMVERKRGHLVGVSSIAGELALPKNSTYCATKAFLTTWLEGLRLDVKKCNIDVTVVKPGFVKTEMTAKNKHPMPFMLELDDAVGIIMKSLEKRDAVCMFPWQLSSAVRFATSLPRPMQVAVARRLR